MYKRQAGAITVSRVRTSDELKHTTLAQPDCDHGTNHVHLSRLEAESLRSSGPLREIVVMVVGGKARTGLV